MFALLRLRSTIITLPGGQASTIFVPTTVTVGNTPSTIFVPPVAVPVTTTPFNGIKTLCPRSSVNPTYTPAAPLPTDFTWGCPPGYLCSPPKVDCNFNAAPPDSKYICSPCDCKKSPPLPPPKFWGHRRVSDLVEKIYVVDDYYVFDPTEFNLTYDVYVIGPRPYKRATLPDSVPNSVPDALPEKSKRQEQISSGKKPPQCLDECQACLYEAQSVGKGPGLCRQGAPFIDYLADCNLCITSKTSGNVPVPPADLAQFANFCQGSNAVIVGSSSAAPVAESQTTGPPASTISTAAAVTPVSISSAPLVVASASASTSTSAIAATSSGTTVVDAAGASSTSGSGGSGGATSAAGTTPTGTTTARTATTATAPSVVFTGVASSSLGSASLVTVLLGWIIALLFG
ncbi:MAG: hypothetical protein M1814_004333 [Vezdaea aestivalis]|nr:MAG: hypothetical protein M1814_004333 [Vezdaea aestivalis]